VTVQAPIARQITGIACVYITVSDPYASAQWYMKNLGLEIDECTPLKPEMGHAILSYPARGQSVFLLGTDDISPPTYRRRDGCEPLNFCLSVTNAQAFMDHLQANGVRLETDILNDGGGCGTSIRCYDPDGNKLELWQPRG
jgi:catechol 2,3-dioxygenase-like lactoylglutathione lyase family enzyme